MKYDAIVIGSGQAGNPLCQDLADQGWQVALVEKDHLGGTCINTGCTPTKTMVASAQVAHYARHADRWGVRTGAVSVDLRRIVARKNEIVQRFRAGHQGHIDRRPFTRRSPQDAGVQASLQVPQQGGTLGRVAGKTQALHRLLQVAGQLLPLHPEASP